MSNQNYDALIKKWEPLLESDSFAKITDSKKKGVTAQLLENTETEIGNGNEWSPKSLIEAAPTNHTGDGIQNYDPVLINMIRRSAPNLIAYDVCGVQPMNGPTGQIFAIRSRYSSQTGPEAFFGEANTGHSTVNGGNTSIVGDAGMNVGEAGNVSGDPTQYNTAGGMSTAQAEALGSQGNVDFSEMAISIEKVMVEAKSRALKAEYTTELAQDLKRIHNLDAEKELSSVLGTEILSEINREVVRTIYVTAVQGSDGTGVATAGTFDFDTDSNGRWMGEKFAGLHFHIETEANAIAKRTRRGKANIMICSSDVASALQMAGVLKYNEAAAGLTIDDTGNTYAGVLGGRIKVYIDPYADRNFMVVGYKGQNSWDAGLFYCPYTPMQMVRAVGENTFQPKIGFKTRYGMVANPFSSGIEASDGKLLANKNIYYRRTLINNIM